MYKLKKKDGEPIADIIRRPFQLGNADVFLPNNDQFSSFGSEIDPNQTFISKATAGKPGPTFQNNLL